MKRSIFWSGVAMAGLGVCALGVFIADRIGGANPVSTATFVLQVVLGAALLVIGAGGMIVLLRHRVICAPGRLVITELRTTEVPLATIADLDWSTHGRARGIRLTMNGRVHTISPDHYDEGEAARLIGHLRRGVPVAAQRHWGRFAERRVRPRSVRGLRAERRSFRRLARRVERGCGAGAVVMIIVGLALARGQIAAPLPAAGAAAAVILAIGGWMHAVARTLRRTQLTRERLRRHLWRTLAAHGVAEPTPTEHDVDSFDLQGDADGT